MPFTMTHLYIADQIIADIEMEKPQEFMLGAMAPDAIHFRANYESYMKCGSHLCIGNEAWGRISNNEEWLANVLSFLEENVTVENRDFLYGYCCHIIADIQNNIKIWTPFRLENLSQLQAGVLSTYHEESQIIDQCLSRSSRCKVFWDLLKRSEGCSLPTRLMKEEIEAFKNAVLNERYKSVDMPEVINHRYVTLSGIQDFINEEAAYIKHVLYSK